MEFESLWKICKPYLEQGRPIDLVHTRISTDFAWRLLKEEQKGDTNIVIPAVMLHDIGYSQIHDEDLYRKSTFPGKSNAVYDIRIKELHLTEGAKLAEKILTEVNYPKHLIPLIAEIVRTHEDLYGGKPDGEDINKVIVSDADKLSRYTAFNLTGGMAAYGREKQEVFGFMYRNIDRWLYLETSKRIAIEELRKLPHDFWPVNKELF